MSSKKNQRKKWYSKFVKKVVKPNKNDKFIDNFSDFFELPRELITSSTKITIIENQRLLIEGYKQVMDYYDNYIKIKTYNNEVVVDGKGLDIKEITDNALIIQGDIYSLNYKE